MMPIETKFICLDEPAFYELIETVVVRLKEKENIKAEKWISGEEAMKLLRITSRTTLQTLRDTGSIVFTQPTPKYILYDRYSIEQYLEKHSRKTF